MKVSSEVRAKVTYKESVEYSDGVPRQSDSLKRKYSQLPQYKGEFSLTCHLRWMV